MIELLSKDHAILERPFMEFRPFGMDERGEKIRDVSGESVRAICRWLLRLPDVVHLCLAMQC